VRQQVPFEAAHLQWKDTVVGRQALDLRWRRDEADVGASSA